MVQAELIWVKHPAVLVRNAAVWPVRGMSFPAKINAITRLVILATAVTWVLFRKTSILVTGAVCMAALVALWKTKDAETHQDNARIAQKEGFQGMQREEIDEIKWTRPTTANPLMNVLLPEIQDTPQRPPAAPAYNPTIEAEINEHTQKGVVEKFDNKAGIDERLFRDLGDSLTFDRSMIGFNATANTQIPNDQKGFAEYCYGKMESAKQGSKQALLRGMGPRVIDGEQ